jgi:hypothetical protein
MIHDLLSSHSTPQATNPQPLSLYRRFFTPTECAMLDAVPLDDLSSEINLLRLLLARTLAAMRKTRSLELKTQAAILSAFSGAGIVIARLVRLQIILHSPLDSLWREIEAGKDLARFRRGVFNYFRPPLPQASR